MTVKEISIARDFSPSPAGRFLTDGPYPGEKFRDEFLLPAIKSNDVVAVDLDGTDGYGSSFLEEAFGGLIRKGISLPELKRKLTVRSSRVSYKLRVWQYISEAATSSK